ncbi:uncharacterized protein LOC5502719 [Nematostella vectensis]|uniref:uncharacterized protein LOC5502719 n=1 Tax=Nematostella vectensis TaxID=45351 RepID=UPI002076E641|nr:uncharacterized protein LOC5502719 [Nematostella vectensis]
MKMLPKQFRAQVGISLALIYTLCIVHTVHAQNDSEAAIDPRNIESLCIKRCLALRQHLTRFRRRRVEFANVIATRIARSNCHRDCTKARSAREAASSRAPRNERKSRAAPTKDCGNLDSDLYTGEIRNLTVDFTQENNGSLAAGVSWVARVSWDLQYANLSAADEERWQGFIVRWFPPPPDSDVHIGVPFCQRTDKNQTWITLVSGEGGWTYPQAIQVLVQTYPLYNLQAPSSFSEFKPNVTVGYSTARAASTSSMGPTPSSTQQIVNTTSRHLPSASSPSDPQQMSNTTTQESDNPQHELDVMTTVTICVGTAVGSALVFCLLRRIHRHYQICRMTPAGDPNYEYDASIIYSSGDQEFVSNELLPLLETKYNLRCFIYYRDWTIGEKIHKNIADTIYKSRYVIAVMSKNFLKSNFCHAELSLALERVISQRDCCLKVINLDGVSKESLPKELQNRTFLDMSQTEERKTWEWRIVRQISREEKPEQKTQGRLEDAKHKKEMFALSKLNYYIRIL